MVDLIYRLIRELHKVKEGNALLKAEFIEEIKQSKFDINFHFKVKDERDKAQSQNKIMRDELKKLEKLFRKFHEDVYDTDELADSISETLNQINQDQSK